MAAEGKKGDSKKQISDKQRFTYIGFDVFPGKPKELFKSDAEKSKHVDAIKAKRDKGDVVREECKLLEDRVTTLDRNVLAFACIVTLGMFIFPWFSAYNEVVEETHDDPISSVAETAIVADSAGLASGDSVGAVAQALDSTVLGAVTNDDALVEEEAIQQEVSSEEILHGIVARKKIHKEITRFAGYSVLLSIGSIFGYLFSSGFVLIMTAILGILFLLSCLALPAYTLYGLYGLKGDADQQALALKNVLKFNWIPVVLFVATFILSFIGAEYGFDGKSLFTSFGSSYGPGVFMGTLSYGIMVSLGAFILNALKGMEI